MFRVAVLVAVLSVFAMPHHADARSDADLHGLKGRVKQVVTERADFADQGGVWTQQPTVGVSVYVYDREGRLIEVDEHDPGMSPHSRTVVTREPDGSETSEQRTFAKDGSLLNTTISVTTYDSKGKKTGERVSGAGGSVQWNEVIVRTDLGETVHERVAGDGSLLYRAVWSSSQEGSRVGDFTTYKDGLPESRSRQVYNQEGQIVSSETYDKDGRLRDRAVFDYRRLCLIGRHDLGGGIPKRLMITDGWGTGRCACY